MTNQPAPLHSNPYPWAAFVALACSGFVFGLYYLPDNMAFLGAFPPVMVVALFVWLRRQDVGATRRYPWAEVVVLAFGGLIFGLAFLPDHLAYMGALPPVAVGAILQRRTQEGIAGNHW